MASLLKAQVGSGFCYEDIEGDFNITSPLRRTLDGEKSSPISVKLGKPHEADQAIMTFWGEISIGGRVTSGCPQVEILSPFLWNWVVDQLLHAIEGQGSKLDRYADDVMGIIKRECPDYSNGNHPGNSRLGRDLVCQHWSVSQPREDCGYSPNETL